MNKSDFHFALPERLIAQTPLARRDHSRMLVLGRESGGLTHDHFYNLKHYLRAGDCLVLNDTRVIPARLCGERAGGGAAEVLLLRRLEGAERWECIVRPGRRLRAGATLTFGGGELTGRVAQVLENGNRIVEFDGKGIFLETLERLGAMPLPPYIKAELKDKTRYQTVYASRDGSAAAPTAGLHFTPSLLDEIAGMGVALARLTLHVGLGTFRPVKAERVEDHVMHSEWYQLGEAAAQTIHAARQAGGRIIAVGTTSCRTLEAAAGPDGRVRPGAGETDIFIRPGYRFKVVDGLITNFHLPESTLIMLVSALAGRQAVLDAYRQAVEAEYRFFSFGDAMLVI